MVTPEKKPWDLPMPSPGTGSPLSKRSSPLSPLDGPDSGSEGSPRKAQRMMDFTPGELSEEERSGITDAMLRYFYYIEYGIPNKQIAPFREEWAGNALAMVPQEPPERVSQVRGVPSSLVV